MAKKIKEISCAGCIYYENWWDEYYNEEEDDYDEYEYAKCKLYERELDPWDFHELHTIAEKCSKYRKEE